MEGTWRTFILSPSLRGQGNRCPEVLKRKLPFFSSSATADYIEARLLAWVAKWQFLLRIGELRRPLFFFCHNKTKCFWFHQGKRKLLWLFLPSLNWKEMDLRLSVCGEAVVVFTLRLVVINHLQILSSRTSEWTQNFNVGFKFFILSNQILFGDTLREGIGLKCNQHLKTPWPIGLGTSTTQSWDVFPDHESPSSERVKYARGFPPFLQAHWVNSSCVNSFKKIIYIWEVALIWVNCRENSPKLGTEGI